MHIIVGKITVLYSGRGNSVLPEYDRIVMLKTDGTISVHSDKGLKPLNYMSGPTTVEKTVVNGLKTWKVSSKKETLEITFHKVYDEINIAIGQDEPGIQMDGTEDQLQLWLSENIGLLDTNLHFVAREYQTGDGPVDILCYNTKTMKYVPVEVKRVAAMGTVGQVLRYLKALEENEPNNQFEAVIAAVEFKQKTLELAAKRNVKCLAIPNDWRETKKTPELSGALF